MACRLKMILLKHGLLLYGALVFGAHLVLGGGFTALSGNRLTADTAPPLLMPSSELQLGVLPFAGVDAALLVNCSNPFIASQKRLRSKAAWQPQIRALKNTLQQVGLSLHLSFACATWVAFGAAARLAPYRCAAMYAYSYAIPAFPDSFPGSFTPVCPVLRGLPSASSFDCFSSIIF